MKLVLQKPIRWSIVGVLALIACILITIGILWSVEPVYKEQSTLQIEYEIIPEMTYKVNLKPNRIYYGESLDASRIYVSSLTESIFSQGTFHIDMAEETSMKGYLLTYAHAISYYGEEEELLWEYYVPVEKRPFEGQGVFDLTSEQTLSVDNIKNKLNYAYNDTGIDPYTEVKMIYKIIGEATNSQATLPVDVEMDLYGPVTSEVYALSQNGMEPTEEDIVDAQTIQVKSVSMMNGYSVLGMFFFVVTCLVFVFSQNKPEKTEYAAGVEKIFKEFSDRLVQLDEAISNPFSSFIHMSTIKDMVKLADEIRQPIFYFKMDEEEDQHIEFYVFDEGRIYYLARYGKSEIALDMFIDDTERKADRIG